MRAFDRSLETLLLRHPDQHKRDGLPSDRVTQDAFPGTKCELFGDIISTESDS